MKSVSGKNSLEVRNNMAGKLLRIHGNHHVYGKAGTITRIS